MDHARVVAIRTLGRGEMFYKPRSSETGMMWDTWLYWHEGTYFLFYLAKSKPEERWDNVSLAISDNGVHWKEQGVILAKRADAVWMGTGSTWASPDFETDGKFFINFSEERGDQQTIFFGESTDLMRWTRLGDDLEFRPDARWGGDPSMSEPGLPLGQRLWATSGVDAGRPAIIAPLCCPTARCR
jgi:hypothetical protein